MDVTRYLEYLESKNSYVEIRGMNIAEEVDPDDEFAYPNRPAWQRFVTIFAGPATNSPLRISGSAAGTAWNSKAARKARSDSMDFSLKALAVEQFTGRRSAS